MRVGHKKQLTLQAHLNLHVDVVDFEVVGRHKCRHRFRVLVCVQVAVPRVATVKQIAVVGRTGFHGYRRSSTYVALSSDWAACKAS